MFRKLHRDAQKTYTELLEIVSTWSGIKNTAYEINSRKGVRKEKVCELQITAIETSQNTMGKKATLAFLLSQAQARCALTSAHLHSLSPPTISHHKCSTHPWFSSGPCSKVSLSEKNPSWPPKVTSPILTLFFSTWQMYLFPVYLPQYKLHLGSHEMDFCLFTVLTLEFSMVQLYFWYEYLVG